MKKILVVNNDIDTMSLLKTWLEKKKYKVQYTGETEIVPEIIEKFNPELLLVDILQKDVVMNLKKIEKTKDVPVLLMTGYAQREKIAEIPANDFIEKPFNLQILENKIKKLIGF